MSRHISAGGHERAYQGATNVWLTPPELLLALGPFDLDPCAATNRPWDTALKHYTEHEDGLSLPWTGCVWLNPPYGPHTGKWLKKLAEHGNGMALIFARAETEMFFKYGWSKADAMLFLRGRLHFHYESGDRAKGNAGAPSVLIAYGPLCVERLRLSGIEGKFVRLTDEEERNQSAAV